MWKEHERWTKELQEQGIDGLYETYRDAFGLHIRLTKNGKHLEALINGSLFRSRSCKSGQRSLLKGVRDNLRSRLKEIE